MAGVEDRVAVVTGAANGLGREIARVLAREGARVALGDLDAAGVERTAAEINARAAGTGVPDGAAFAVAGDLTEEGPAHRGGGGALGAA
jgi:NAD(P)-dependent dehydrogenase (short-subunit alcohol dehydrogenase family)